MTPHARRRSRRKPPRPDFRNASKEPSPRLAANPVIFEFLMTANIKPAAAAAGFLCLGVGLEIFKVQHLAHALLDGLRAGLRELQHI